MGNLLDRKVDTAKQELAAERKNSGLMRRLFTGKVLVLDGEVVPETTRKGMGLLKVAISLVDTTTMSASRRIFLPDEPGDGSEGVIEARAIETINREAKKGNRRVGRR